MLYRLSIRHKILLIMMLAIAVVVFAASSLWMYYDWQHLKKQMVEDLRSSASELSVSLSSAVMNNERKKILKIISMLRVNNNVISAWVTNDKRMIIANYTRMSNFLSNNKDYMQRQKIKERLVMTSQADNGYHFFEKAFAMEYPLVYQGELIGHLYIFHRINLLKMRLYEHAQITLIIVFLSLLMGLIVSLKMHRVISNPIVKLAGVMDRVSHKKDYSLRANIANQKDEIGDLISVFNEMLNEIESHIEMHENDKKQISQLAYFDSLTSLPNRRFFEENLQLAIDDHHANHKKFALAFIDLDNFKTINDTLGHDKGDELLKQVTERLLSCMHFKSDDPTETNKDYYLHPVARLGGDEFVIIFPNGDINKINKRFKKILKKFKAPFHLTGHKFDGSLSIGIAIFPDHGSNSVDLIKSADSAMYQAKNAGKATFKLYQD